MLYKVAIQENYWKIPGWPLERRPGSHKIRPLRKKFCPFKFMAGKENIRENSSLHKGNIFPARKSLVSDIPARSWKRDREFFYSDSLNAQYSITKVDLAGILFCNIVFMRIDPGTWNLTVCSARAAPSSPTWGGRTA
jgi:hypothetical protein